MEGKPRRVSSDVVVWIYSWGVDSTPYFFFVDFLISPPRDRVKDETVSLKIQDQAYPTKQSNRTAFLLCVCTDHTAGHDLLSWILLAEQSHSHV